MIRTRTLAALVALAATLAACSAPGGRPAATVTGVNPTAITASGDITVDGTDFFGIVGGQGVEIEVCGVRVPAEVVDGALRSVVLPPAGRVRIEEGTRVTATLPAEGLTSGPSDLRILLPDGSVTTYPDAVTCSDGTFRVRLDVQQTIDGFGGAPRTVTYDASASTGEGDLTFAWEPVDTGLVPTAPGPVDGPVLSTLQIPDTLRAFHLTVTDEAGESGERTVVTAIDSAETQGETPDIGDGPSQPQGLTPSDVDPTIDVTRMTWYQDVADAVIEVETLAPHALVAPGTPVVCDPVDETPTLGLEAPLEMIGALFVIPAPDESVDRIGFESGFVIDLTSRTDDGRFPIYAFASEGPCDDANVPTPPLGYATSTTDGSVSTFEAPQSVVGADDVLVFGGFGSSTDLTLDDTVGQLFMLAPTGGSPSLESFGLR